MNRKSTLNIHMIAQHASLLRHSTYGRKSGLGSLFNYQISVFELD